MALHYLNNLRTHIQGDDIMATHPQSAVATKTIFSKPSKWVIFHFPKEKGQILILGFKIARVHLTTSASFQSKTARLTPIFKSHQTIFNVPNIYFFFFVVMLHPQFNFYWPYCVDMGKEKMQNILYCLEPIIWFYLSKWVMLNEIKLFCLL